MSDPKFIAHEIISAQGQEWHVGALEADGKSHLAALGGEPQSLVVLQVLDMGNDTKSMYVQIQSPVEGLGFADLPDAVSKHLQGYVAKEMADEHAPPFEARLEIDTSTRAPEVTTQARIGLPKFAEQDGELQLTDSNDWQITPVMGSDTRKPGVVFKNAQTAEHYYMGVDRMDPSYQKIESVRVLQLDEAGHVSGKIDLQEIAPDMKKVLAYQFIALAESNNVTYADNVLTQMDVTFKDIREQTELAKQRGDAPVVAANQSNQLSAQQENSMSEQPEQDFDRIVNADGKSYGVKTTSTQTNAGANISVAATELESKAQYTLRPADKEGDLVVNANLTAKGQAGKYPTPATADKLPAALRNVMADELGEAMGEAGMQMADEVLENLRDGKPSLKAPPAEERAINAQYKRMMKGVDIDGETAKIIAEDRLNEFRNKAVAAHESGDKEAYDKAHENLLAALDEQPELDEAATELSKPKGHHAREAYEAKRGGDVVEGITQEEGHVARLKAERAAEPEQGKEGQAR